MAVQAGQGGIPCISFLSRTSITDNQIALTKEKERQQEVKELFHEYIRSNLQILD